MKQLRRTLSLILLFCLCLQATVYAQQTSPGSEEGPAAPVQKSEPVNRLAFCQQLYTALAELGQPPQAVTAAPFTDTTDEAVAALYGAGIVNGDGSGLFFPSLPITQEQAVIMAARAVDWLGAKLEAPEQGLSSPWMDTPSFAVCAGLLDTAVPTGYEAGKSNLTPVSCSTFLTWVMGQAQASLSKLSLPLKMKDYRLSQVVVSKPKGSLDVLVILPDTIAEGETVYDLWLSRDQRAEYIYIGKEAALQISYRPDSKIYGEQQASFSWEDDYVDYYLGLSGKDSCMYVLYAPGFDQIRLQYWPMGYQDGPLGIPGGTEGTPTLTLKKYLALVKLVDLPQFMPK